VNIKPLFADIISRRLASLAELETIYSYSDALDMGEILMVSSYNHWASRAEVGGSRR